MSGLRARAFGRGLLSGPPLTRRVTPKLGAYAALAAAGFLAAVLLGRPEAALLAMPFALVAVLGMALVSEPVLDLDLGLDRDRVLVGEEVELRLTVRALTSVASLEVTPAVAWPLSVASGGMPPAQSFAAGEERTIRCRFTVGAWGVHDLGRVTVRAHDHLGVFHFEQRMISNLPLRAYPRPEQLSALLSPRSTRPHAGNRVSRERGSGLEPADIREFVPGDLIRHVNWRATARRSELHVNQHHPERSTDVVIFIDTFAEAGEGPRTTLDLAVGAAASLAHGYLRSRDRVGLIGFGGVLRWVRPGLGRTHLYRLMDSLLDTRVVSSYAWKGIDVIPRGTLPPKALLLAITPLLDPRSIAALLDVRGRGFDVAVIEVDPSGLAIGRGDERGSLAWRLWILEREATRERLRRGGIAVAGWDGTLPLEAALEEVRASRRSARYPA